MASTPEITGGGILGKEVQGARRQLDVFDLHPTVTRVQYTSDEVASICPITSQPDFYKVSITLDGTVKGIESKSLKLYLQSFADEGQFCEAFSATIAIFWVFPLISRIPLKCAEVR